MSQEFPVGERVIFLGKQVYGAASQVVSTTKDAMKINVAVGPWAAVKVLADYLVLPLRGEREPSIHLAGAPKGFWSLLPIPHPVSSVAHFRTWPVARNVNLACSA